MLCYTTLRYAILHYSARLLISHMNLEWSLWLLPNFGNPKLYYTKLNVVNVTRIVPQTVDMTQCTIPPSLPPFNFPSLDTSSFLSSVITVSWEHT